MIRNNRTVFLTRTALAVVATLAAGAAGMNGKSSLLVSQAQANAPITLALRIIALSGENGQPVISPETAQKVAAEVNQEYAPCGIQFALESFEPASAKDRGLEFNTSSMAELDRYRSQFDDSKSLVVIATGEWKSNMAPANAWAAMPGESPMGVVLEAPVADYSQIVAHELGHYLGLPHLSDEGNMMNPVIEKHSTTISADQCTEMRKTAESILAPARR